MGAADVLLHLRCAGLVLTVTPAGELHVGPRQSITDEHRAAIRAERDGLVALLKAKRAAFTPPAGRGIPAGESSGAAAQTCKQCSPSMQCSQSIQCNQRRQCNQCMHRLRVGTCARPIEAGLIDPLAGFGIVWAPRGFAATCRAFAAVGRGA